MGIFNFNKFKKDLNDNEQKNNVIEQENYDKTFDYNPLEDKVSINIIQNENPNSKMLSTYIVLDIYDKDEQVYIDDEQTVEGLRLNTNAKVKNEIVLKEIKTANNETITTRDEQIKLVERLYKRISIAISNIIDSENLSEVQKKRSISICLSELDYLKISKYSNSHIMKNTIDGEKFDILTKINDENLLPEGDYIESSTTNRASRKTEPISFEKSLYRENGFKICSYPLSYIDELKQNVNENVTYTEKTKSNDKIIEKELD